MFPKNIPDDINVEVLLSYLQDGSYKVMFNGMHKRNAYNDILEIAEEGDTMMLTLGRGSLYNKLPELLFHPIDRFDNLPAQNEKERFREEYEAQIAEIKNARKFFAPIDLMLLKLRMTVRERLDIYATSDKVLMDILGDELTKEQKQNRFCRQILPFLPFCKYIRGNRTLLTMMLRKALKEETLDINIAEKPHETIDLNPRYDICLGEKLESLYVGNTFNESVLTYDIHYWSEEECNEHFLRFIDEMETLRQFIQDYFMSLEVILHFNISHDSESTILSNDISYQYLNYNTNL
jgi:hypothetical protein